MGHSGVQSGATGFAGSRAGGVGNRRITFQEEDFRNVWPELSEYWEANWKETRQDGDDRPLRVDLERYLKAAQAGVLKVLTARENEKLVGYYGFYLMMHPKAGELFGKVDSYYLAPDFRGMNGVRLLKAGEALAKQHGATWMLAATKKHGKLFERMGYEVNEILYGRKL
jgi:GNAT superfamily N-acetyltransferase